MLVLSRKVGQRIVIGDDITVVINRVSGNRVSIGVEAPSDMKIIRGELERFVDEFEDTRGEPVKSTALPTSPLNFDDSTTAFVPRIAR